MLIRRVRLAPDQVSADPRSRRRRTRHPDRRALPITELADLAVYAYSFILTNLDVSTPERAAAVEHWYRHRTQIEKHPRRPERRRAATPPVGISAGQQGVEVGCAARGQHRRLAAPAHRHPPPDGELTGHGVRDGQAMIATLRHKLICVPARLVRHAGALTLRLPPGHELLETVLARIRALPAMS